MKNIAVLLSVIIAGQAQAQFVDYDSVHIKNGVTIYTAYQQTKYSRVPSGDVQYMFRVAHGQLEQSIDGGTTWLEYDKAPVDSPKQGDWIARHFLSNLVFLAKPTKVQATLDKNTYPFDLPAIRGNDIFEVGSSYNGNEDGKQVPYVSIFERDGSSSKLLSSFIIDETNFQFRPGESIFLNDSLMAIFAGTEDSGVTFMVLYDVKTKSPIGFTSFDQAILLPQANIIGFSNSLPRGLARTLSPGPIKEMPIFIGTTLNSLLTDKTLLRPSD